MAAILREMKHPILSDGGLPTPLTGIETPRVDVEDRGSLRTSKPVYASFGNWGRPLSPPKKSESKVSTDVPKPVVVKKECSSSEQDESSSDSGSEESDEKDDVSAAFGLASIMNPIRTSPGLSSSERSVKPDPSPRYPTQSPYTGLASQGQLSQSPSPMSGAGGKSDKSGPASPLPSMDLPALMPPLSPMADGPPSPVPSPVPTKSHVTDDSDHDIVHTKPVKPPSKPSNSSVQLSSDEEIEMETYREKQKKRKKASTTKSGSGSERGRNRKVPLDDSDDENDPFTINKDKSKISHGRSHSTSPIKKPSSRKTPSTL